MMTETGVDGDGSACADARIGCASVPEGSKAVERLIALVYREGVEDGVASAEQDRPVVLLGSCYCARLW